ncbi:unnamed protein product [Linum trigynum]|uniref:Major facilitator superfamily (MFS) profile domain-containing protein n=1 Tax=Linum trigynum TaxID=586398 RepID=A0AAV2FQD5_9ROSI
MSAAQTAHFHDDTKYVAFFASGFVADFLGRRWALVISGVVSSFALLATSLAPSCGVLISGRLVSLLGAGLGLPVAPAVHISTSNTSFIHVSVKESLSNSLSSSSEERLSHWKKGSA